MTTSKLLLLAASCGLRQVLCSTTENADVPSRFFDAAADLLLGASCPGCDSPGWSLCSECLRTLRSVEAIPPQQLPVSVVAVAPYRPLLARVIPRFKDEGAWQLSRPLGALLADLVIELDPPADARLVPIPSRPRAVRARGFDHVAALCQVVSRRTGLPCWTGLRRRDIGVDQEGLGRVGRAQNLTGTMFAKGCSSPVLLVDDVVTSGATLSEACRTLSTARVEVINALVLAVA